LPRTQQVRATKIQLCRQRLAHTARAATHLLIAAIAFILHVMPILAIITAIMLAMLIGIAYRNFARQPA
jgi:predicted membrane protein